MQAPIVNGEACSYIRATHRLGDADWLLGGLYRHAPNRTPAGWKVKSMRLSLIFEEGERTLVEQAGRRAAAQQGG